MSDRSKYLTADGRCLPCGDEDRHADPGWPHWTPDGHRCPCWCSTSSDGRAQVVAQWTPIVVEGRR